MLHWLIDLVEQKFCHLGVINTIFGQRYRFELTASWVCSDMQFAPGASFGLAMCSHFSFAFAMHFQTGTIHDNVDMAADCLRQNNVQVLATPRQSGMVWNRQLHAKYGKDRTHKPFCGPVWRMKYILHRQHNRDRLSIVIVLAATLLFSNISPALFKIVRQPDRDRTTLNQCFVGEWLLWWAKIHPTAESAKFAEKNKKKLCVLPRRLRPGQVCGLRG